MVSAGGKGAATATGPHMKQMTRNSSNCAGRLQKEDERGKNLIFIHRPLICGTILLNVLVPLFFIDLFFTRKLNVFMSFE